MKMHRLLLIAAMTLPFAVACKQEEASRLLAEHGMSAADIPGAAGAGESVLRAAVATALRFLGAFEPARGDFLDDLRAMGPSRNGAPTGRSGASVARGGGGTKAGAAGLRPAARLRRASRRRRDR